ncbi:MAG: HD domain-containing protein [Solirubrobacteraceae bacterium]|nr:HD domain-containing protein [Solirubrobacteraceae bacterium]
MAPLTDRFDRALLYASAHHRDDVRKGTGIPYLSHLLAVAGLVMEMEAGEDEAIAALLHDVVEDGGGLQALEEIRETWGDDVARIVLANSDSTVKDAPKAPWRERKVAYLDAIAHKAPDELRVSLADKLHNARSIARDHAVLGDALWSRFTTGSADDQRWYYGALLTAFRARADELGAGAAPVLDALERTIAEFGA